MFKATVKVPGISDPVHVSCDGEYNWDVSHHNFGNYLIATGLISEDPYWPPGSWDVRDRFLRLMKLTGAEILEFQIVPGPNDPPAFPRGKGIFV